MAVILIEILKLIFYLNLP